MSLTSIPDELLREVLLYLPRPSQNACLLTCKAVHAVAVPIVFRMISISFGSLQEHGFEPDDVLVIEKTLWETQKARSIEILDYICRNPGFARVIQRLLVYAYAQNDDAPKILGRLVTAVASMTHLQAVLWAGVGWNMDPLQWRLRLTSFSVKSQMGIDYATVENAEETTAIIPYIEKIIGHNTETLRRVAIPCVTMGSIPPNVFGRLTHLAIWNCKDLHHVDQIFLHAHSLVSLALVEVIGPEIFHVLRAHATALPNLAQFKLMILEQMDPDEEETDTLAIRDFIQNRELDRLDIDAPGSISELILDVLPKCERLSALGLDARGVSSDDDVKMLADSIPPNLVALHIQHPWEGLSLDSYELQPLLTKYAEMPRLRFLHWQNPVPSSRIIVEALAEDIPMLDYMGLGTTFWRIIREVGPDGETIVGAERIQQAKLMLDVWNDDELVDERWLLEWHDGET
ncbi:hypothetical protein PUNSTDRAFT_138042 [Punctularia strigosozonata HHB-11173 SS5]|uniref:F-box domain-containing protein n=1 Tax=Punctularia strigosozonata (strain HHB-11173) TaxID=741275 RepID=R7S4U6_PUNST|nr:uncharacterized protein PUNSTDRAFT_138042 [Punctularia strigosozonata HHB-11173 SS5]EIN04842.1 hypothetical protein PUNSTDRAFT_138042 [Punctularia strigosozonata HHB-11173 SS5]